MSESKPAQPSTGASCLGLSWRRGAAVSLVALLGACAPSIISYRGTGSLQTSGSTPDVSLASQGVSFTECPSATVDENIVEGFSILAIGDGSRCSIAGFGDEATFQPDPGSVCTLAFAEGTRTVSVTDIFARPANGSRAPPNWKQLGIQLGGDDAASGRHVLYHFAGRAIDSRSCDTQDPGGASPEAACAQSCLLARPKHARVPGAIRSKDDHAAEERRPL